MSDQRQHKPVLERELWNKGLDSRIAVEDRRQRGFKIMHQAESEPGANRRSDIERRGLKWCVVVDEDCDPVTNVAHLMYLCGDEHMDICEESARHPVCGQVFRIGWMQDDATDKQRHCKKCIRVDKRLKQSD